jgi:DNA-directed RNA polymerase subunit alpha
MLNLKDLVIDKKDDGIEWPKLSKKKAGKVTASDIKLAGGVKIMNPDLYVTEIDKDGLEIDIEIRIEKGVGYLSVEDLKRREDDVNMLLIDANFSPVLNVKYEVKNTRFGDITNLESLEMSITTNGIISSVDALKFSGDMLKSYFSSSFHSNII